MSFPDSETQFQHGNPGGPGGKRGRNRPISDALKDRLACKAGTRPFPETVADEIADKLLFQACRGNLPAIQTVLNRTEGRAPLTVQVEHEHGIDGELRAILRPRLGVPGCGAETGAETDPGPVESGGTGGGDEPGSLEAGPAPETAERPSVEVHGGDRPAGEPPPLDLDAAQARQK